MRRMMGSVVGKKQVAAVLMFLCLLAVSTLHVVPVSAKEETFVEEYTYSKIEYTISALPDQILTDQEVLITGRMKLLEIRGLGENGFILPHRFGFFVESVLGLDEEALLYLEWCSSTWGDPRASALNLPGQSYEFRPIRVFINGSLMREDVDSGLLKVRLSFGSHPMTSLEEPPIEYQHAEQTFELVVKRGALPAPEYKEKYEETKRSYDELKGDFSSLQSDHSTLQKSYSSLQTDFDKLKEKQASLSADYDSLKSEYDSLKSDYDPLKSRLDDLQAKYDDLEARHKSVLGELGSAKSLMYVFIATTVVFIAATAFFAVRKTRVKA